MARRRLACVRARERAVLLKRAKGGKKVAKRGQTKKEKRDSQRRRRRMEKKDDMSSSSSDSESDSECDSESSVSSSRGRGGRGRRSREKGREKSSSKGSRGAPPIRKTPAQVRRELCAAAEITLAKAALKSLDVLPVPDYLVRPVSDDDSDEASAPVAPAPRGKKRRRESPEATSKDKRTTKKKKVDEPHKTLPLEPRPRLPTELRASVWSGRSTESESETETESESESESESEEEISENAPPDHALGSDSDSDSGSSSGGCNFPQPGRLVSERETKGVSPSSFEPSLARTSGAPPEIASPTWSTWSPATQGYSQLYRRADVLELWGGCTAKLKAARAAILRRVNAHITSEREAGVDPKIAFPCTYAPKSGGDALAVVTKKEGPNTVVYFQDEDKEKWLALSVWESKRG
jgi:hypothetical protein